MCAAAQPCRNTCDNVWGARGSGGGVGPEGAAQRREPGGCLCSISHIFIAHGECIIITWPMPILGEDPFHEYINFNLCVYFEISFALNSQKLYGIFPSTRYTVPELVLEHRMFVFTRPVFCVCVCVCVRSQLQSLSANRPLPHRNTHADGVFVCG